MKLLRSFCIIAFVAICTFSLGFLIVSQPTHANTLDIANCVNNEQIITLYNIQTTNEWIISYMKDVGIPKEEIIKTDKALSIIMTEVNKKNMELCLSKQGDNLKQEIRKNYRTYIYLQTQIIKIVKGMRAA